jgi:hypothetical protein
VKARRKEEVEYAENMENVSKANLILSKAVKEMRKTRLDNKSILRDLRAALEIMCGDASRVAMRRRFEDRTP